MCESVSYIYYYVGRNGKNQYLTGYVWDADAQTYRIWLSTDKSKACRFEEDEPFVSSGFAACFKRETVKKKMYCVVSCGWRLTRDANGKINMTLVPSRATTFHCKEDAAQFLAEAAVAGHVSLSIDEV